VIDFIFMRKALVTDFTIASGVMSVFILFWLIGKVARRLFTSE